MFLISTYDNLGSIYVQGNMDVERKGKKLKSDLWHLHLRECLRSAVGLHATVVTHPTLSIVETLTFVSIDYNI